MCPLPDTLGRDSEHPAEKTYCRRKLAGLYRSKVLDRLEMAVRGHPCCGTTAPHLSQRDCKNSSWELDCRLAASGYHNIRKGRSIKLLSEGEDLWL